MSSAWIGFCVRVLFGSGGFADAYRDLWIMAMRRLTLCLRASGYCSSRAAVLVKCLECGGDWQVAVCLSVVVCGGSSRREITVDVDDGSLSEVGNGR